MWKSGKDFAEGAVANSSGRQPFFDVFAEEDAVRKRMEEDPQKVTDLIRTQTGIRLARLEEAKKTGAETVDGCKQILKSLLALLSDFTQKLPSVGFFTQNKDSLYPEYCHLLVGLEERERALNRGLLRLSAVLETDPAVRAKISCLCELLREKDGLSAVDRTVFDAWEKVCRQEKRYADQIRGICDALQAYCGTVLPAFCEKTRLAADQENDGSGLKLSALGQLCGELRTATERLLATTPEEI